EARAELVRGDEGAVRVDRVGSVEGRVNGGLAVEGLGLGGDVEMSRPVEVDKADGGVGAGDLAVGVARQESAVAVEPVSAFRRLAGCFSEVKPVRVSHSELPRSRPGYRIAPASRASARALSLSRGAHYSVSGREVV